ncbi:DUF2157 domain-containing protein [Flavobacterium branchiophilum]|uniref:DUF2157 domain-containing protein n=2 Tax=Flavobacterium branchiophilum TaxID=55197 RepID=A0A2H3KDV3_9FLAO|nr:DUF2157 domain-containing protein [Flavobacterium branchiophilum]PDS24886.1 DUF2157 domain-containing protein [Flavobacterium branchiophilum]CCB69936.1 Hypothetical transmembrane protein [Flavobacterium branchiophilum FL-15]
MTHFHQEYTQKLLNRNYISESQYHQIETFRAKPFFSIRHETLLLLYTAIMLFTSGVGLLIYENIDTIGHSILLVGLFLITSVGFYFSFKKAPKYSPLHTEFENPVYEYLVLGSFLLCCIFIGYWQFQYHFLGNSYKFATLLPTIVGFGCAYYFDHKGILSIAISGLTAFIGLQISITNIFHFDFFNNLQLYHYGIILSFALVFWSLFADLKNIKSHFSIVFQTFALHLVFWCSIGGLCSEVFGYFVIIPIVSGFYFYNKSYNSNSIMMYIFTVIYTYICFNIIFIRLVDIFNIQSDLFQLFIIITPFYIMGSIALFLYGIRNFNKNIKKNHENIPN